VLYGTVRYGSVRYGTVLYGINYKPTARSTVKWLRYGTVPVPHGTVTYRTLLYRTVRYPGMQLRFNLGIPRLGFSSGFPRVLKKARFSGFLRFPESRWQVCNVLFILKRAICDFINDLNK